MIKSSAAWVGKGGMQASKKATNIKTESMLFFKIHLRSDQVIGSTGLSKQ
jgi:hypothetical protein